MAYRILYYGKDGEIREYEPCKRTITFFRKPYFLQFPYTIFHHHRDKLFVAFSDKPIESVNSLVFLPTVGNVYERGRICGCDARDIDGAISEFWQKDFTTDGRYWTLVKAFKTNLMFSLIYYFLVREFPFWRLFAVKCALRKWARMTKKGRKDLIFQKIASTPGKRFHVFFGGYPYHNICSDEEGLLENLRTELVYG